MIYGESVVDFSHECSVELPDWQLFADVLQPLNI